MKITIDWLNQSILFYSDTYIHIYTHTHTHAQLYIYIYIYFNRLPDSLNSQSYHTRGYRLHSTPPFYPIIDYIL